MNTNACFALACAAFAGALTIILLHPSAWPVLATAAGAGAIGYVASRYTRR